MDATRFDDLVRQLSQHRPRRTVAGALVAVWVGLFGVKAGGERAAAKRASIPLGGACNDHHECYNDIDAITRPDLNYQNQLVWCMENGFWQDGERNCCRYEGGLCWVDGHCCRDLQCVGGYCGGVSFD
ncbi:MAG: hypothetical protein U0031_03745 [Thermomicrobiales bacterium]